MNIIVVIFCVFSVAVSSPPPRNSGQLNINVHGIPGGNIVVQHSAHNSQSGHVGRADIQVVRREDSGIGVIATGHGGNEGYSGRTQIRVSTGGQTSGVGNFHSSTDIRGHSGSASNVKVVAHSSGQVRSGHINAF